MEELGYPWGDFGDVVLEVLEPPADGEGGSGLGLSFTILLIFLNLLGDLISSSGDRGCLASGCCGLSSVEDEAAQLLLVGEVARVLDELVEGPAVGRRGRVVGEAVGVHCWGGPLRAVGGRWDASRDVMAVVVIEFQSDVFS